VLRHVTQQLFTAVSLVEAAPDGGDGVGAVKRTRFRGLSGRERILALTPDRQFSYGYIRGAFTPSIRHYVAVIDLRDDADGTDIIWHATFTARFPGSGWLPQRILTKFLQRCADGLAAAATTPGLS